LVPAAPALQVQSLSAPLLSGELEWAGHGSQVLELALRTVENWPAAQFVHSALPAAVLYPPGGHALHAAPSAPVRPGLQMQSRSSPLPAGACVLSGHAVHSRSPNPENVSAAHSWQLSAESDALEGE